MTNDNKQPVQEGACPECGSTDKVEDVNGVLVCGNHFCDSEPWKHPEYEAHPQENVVNNIALLPLPKAHNLADYGDVPVRGYDNEQLQAYARANVAHATAARDAEIARWKDAAEMQSAITKALLPYQDEAVAGRAEVERLADALRKIATVAHAGGSVGMSEADALTAIRKLTLKHWDRNAEPKHVRAALSTNAATQTGERTW